MNIDSSAISMQAAHNSTKIQTQTERFRMWIGERPDSGERNVPNDTGVLQDTVQISGMARQIQAEMQRSQLQARVQSTGSAAKPEKVEVELSEEDKQKILLIEKFLEQLKGKKVKLHVPEKLLIKEETVTLDMEEAALELQRITNEGLEGWGIEYEYHESYCESEELSFKAKGEIHTADGETINFSIKMKLKREYAEETHISIKAGDAAKPKVVDPLTISFNGEMPDLTDAKFSFDLDADGKIDQVSFATAGSGFLALDQNEDGVINDGQELFGPTSGNGFLELAQYDGDQNDWIDKNDDIFDQLRIWTKGANGDDRLLALGQVGIGAIYLGHIDTPFSLTNDQNELNGQISRTGIYVKDDNSVGTIHQVDLTV